MTKLKTCKDCGQAKPLDEFYRVSGSQHLYLSYCKKCLVIRNKIYKADKSSGNKAEEAALQELERLGIPAMAGRDIRAYNYVDILALGCVKIEVKFSLSHGGQYSFGLSPKQYERGLIADIIILVIGNPYEFYYFYADDPIFCHPDTRKKRIVYQPDAIHRKGKAVLTKHMMRKAKDNWQIIWKQFAIHSRHLRGQSADDIHKTYTPHQLELFPD